MQGETIQAISQKETGTIDNWQTIVSQNGLKYPYIVATLAEKKKDLEHLVMPGDHVVIPIETNLLTDIDPTTLSKRDQEFIESVALGRDLNVLGDVTELNKYGTSDTLVGLSATTSGDVSTVYGVDNVKQATITRLSTAKGSLLLHPDYGSNLYNLFGKATLEQMLLIQTEIQRCVLCDTRITACDLNEQSITANVYTGSFTAKLQSIEKSFQILIEGDSSGNIILT
jgi:hypothetical protein